MPPAGMVGEGAPIHKQLTLFCSIGIVPVEVMEWSGTVRPAAPHTGMSALRLDLGQGRSLSRLCVHLDSICSTVAGQNGT